MVITQPSASITRPSVAAPRYQRDDYAPNQGRPGPFDQYKGPMKLTAACWAAEIVDASMGGALDVLGVHPRTGAGLIVGVPSMPFLHGGFGHLLSNSIGILALGGMVAASGKNRFRDVTIASALTSGLTAWAIGASGSVHLGASGVVFGYMGYTLANGVLERSPKSLAMAGIALALFGGSLTTMLPGVPGISWEGHLGGFIGGVIAAKVLHDRDKKEPN